MKPPRCVQLARCLTAALLLTAAAAPAQAETSKLMYSFMGAKDGGHPVSGVIVDPEGNHVYGTTSTGGTGYGAAYELTRPSSGKRWIMISLHVFTGGNDGATPYGPLTMDASGALYGTTTAGGSHGHGVVFRLNPPAPPDTRWTETVLHQFTGGNDGAEPLCTLLLDNNGAVYGTAPGAGKYGYGVAFRLNPPAPGGHWTETVLHQFTGGNDGANPDFGLVMDGEGNLYGTTINGGLDGKGVAFELLAPAAGKTAWHEKIMYAFPGQPGGAYPSSGLIFDDAGNLYGTTLQGGTSAAAGGAGTVYQLALPAAGEYGRTATIIFSFLTSGVGYYPLGGLARNKLTGTLYGTTLGYAQTEGCPKYPDIPYLPVVGPAVACGTVFQSVPSSEDNSWVTTSYAVSGQSPVDIGGLSIDAAGVVYGTETNAGAAQYGIAFMLIP